MSWVFLVDRKAFKLKKPVRFPYLDYSTLSRREAACRAELALNRRLARPVYLGVVPLSLSQRNLSIGGAGIVVDWLVVMKRLDEDRLLDHAIKARRVGRLKIERVADTLAQFYRTASRPFLSPEQHLHDWHRNLALNRRTLLDPKLELPSPLVRWICHAQRRFLEKFETRLKRRVVAKRIVDGHGDLRPEHIWLNNTPQIIDCLEFSPKLRTVDPFDDIAYLSLECERLGAAWVGELIARRLVLSLHDTIPRELFAFYRCYRATLRARLAIAHLLEPQPRTPEKWPHLAVAYLRIAAKETAIMERSI